MNKRSDIHIHSHFDDGAVEMTVANVIKKAESKSLDEIGIVMHYHDSVPHEVYRMQYGAGLYPEEFPPILERLIQEVRNASSKIEIRVGIETEIKDLNGSLCASQDVIDKVDFVLISCHWWPEELLPMTSTSFVYKDRKQALTYYESKEWGSFLDSIDRHTVIEKFFMMHKRVMSQHPSFVLAHPTFVKLALYRVIESFKEVHENLLDLADTMAKTETSFNITEPMVRVIENPSIDNGVESIFWESFMDWIDICKRKGVNFLAGSDAHSLERVGEIEGCYRILK